MLSSWDCLIDDLIMLLTGVKICVWCTAVEISFVQGLNSLSDKTSYHQISCSLEAASLDLIMIVSLWNSTGSSAALSILERLETSKPQSHSPETSQDIEARRPSPQWIQALIVIHAAHISLKYDTDSSKTDYHELISNMFEYIYGKVVLIDTLLDFACKPFTHLKKA